VPALTLLLAMSLGTSGSGRAVAQVPPELLGRPAHAIVRDAFGVPHVYAEAPEAGAFGMGYAQAEDMLWPMFLIKLSALGRTSELGDPAEVEVNHAVRMITYSQQEREQRLAAWPDDLRALIEAYSAGVNAYVDDANLDVATKLPVEFLEFRFFPVESWRPTDTLAVIDMLAHQAAGGGGEVGNAALRERLIGRLGPSEGAAAWEDLVMVETPGSPTTIPADYPYRTRPTGARDREVEARRGLSDDARMLAVTAVVAGDGWLAGLLESDPLWSPAVEDATGTGAQYGLVDTWQQAAGAIDRVHELSARAYPTPHTGSNAQVVGPVRSSTGNSGITAGPQNYYSAPSFYWEGGLHVEGVWDVVGKTVIGAGPLFYGARGRGYGWALTNGSSDVQDVYVEQLNPDNPREYRFQGRFEPMSCRAEAYRGYERSVIATREVCRTRHGVVLWTEGDVAYVLRSAVFDRSQQWVRSFVDLAGARSLEDFATALMTQSTPYNLHYADDQGHIGYWQPSNMPQRPRGADMRLPLDGRGNAEWRGLLPVQEIPHAVDLPRGWLVNWNNQPAVGWPRERGWRARERVLALQAAHLVPGEPAPFGGAVDADGMGFDGGDLERGLRHAAYADLHWYALQDVLPTRAELRTPQARTAVDLLTAYSGFRTPATVAQYVMSEYAERLELAVFSDDLASDIDWARGDSGSWLVLSPNSPARLRYDWLNGADPRDVVVDTFEATIATIVLAHGTDPGGWPTRGTGTTSYVQLSSELQTASHRRQVCSVLDLAGGLCPDVLRDAADSGFPGDVRDHHAMNRGNYNHVISYLDRPTGSEVLGESRAEACSINTPGNSARITIAGGESPHFDDQLELFARWQWKGLHLDRDAVTGAAVTSPCTFASATAGDGLEP